MLAGEALAPLRFRGTRFGRDGFDGRAAGCGRDACAFAGDARHGGERKPAGGELEHQLGGARRNILVVVDVSTAGVYFVWSSADCTSIPGGR